jgi:hypothetical protein
VSRAHGLALTGLSERFIACLGDQKMRISLERTSAHPDHPLDFFVEGIDSLEPACTGVTTGNKSIAALATKWRSCVIGLVAMTMFAEFDIEPAQAHFRRYRQYYGGWTYNPIQTYYYRPYYYLPYATATTYSYHYVVSYAAEPQYYYYYNPVRRYYWGRYDRKAKGYSLLAEKDRRGKLEEIPDTAFPKPGKMPNIPESKDGVAMEVAPDDVPKDPAAAAAVRPSAAKVAAGEAEE